jgi:signal transduction histidine kinase
VNKLNETLSRLSNYRKGADSDIAPIDLPALAQQIAVQKSPSHPVNMLGPDALTLLGDKESLEQVLLHLVQNAIDATPNDADAIIIQWRRKGDTGYIEIADQGTGMSADFVRNKLFKPFSSQKAGGFGIGAFEAKALVIAMGGMLEVESIENVGTRMIISLPVAKTDPLQNIEVNEAVPGTITNPPLERA